MKFVLFFFLVLIKVNTLSAQWHTISTGFHHTIGLKKDGTMWGWGLGKAEFGAAGIGDVYKSSKPLQIGIDKDWAMIAAGGRSSYAIKSDGSFYVWGRGYRSELGDGIESNQLTPKKLEGFENCKEVYAIRSEVIVLKKDGTYWAWGSIFSRLPVKIGNTSDWSKVIAGYDKFIIQKTDGSLWYLRFLDKPLIRVNEEQSQWKSIASSESHLLAIKKDGSLWVKGRSLEGQSGIGEYLGSKNQIEIKNSVQWVSVACGSLHSLALKNDGTVWASGENICYEAGIDSTQSHITQFTKLPVSDIVFITTFDRSSFLIDKSGKAYSFGLNESKQLGVCKDSSCLGITELCE